MYGLVAKAWRGSTSETFPPLLPMLASLMLTKTYDSSAFSAKDKVLSEELPHVLIPPVLRQSLQQQIGLVATLLAPPRLVASSLLALASLARGAERDPGNASPRLLRNFSSSADGPPEIRFHLRTRHDALTF